MSSRWKSGVSVFLLAFSAMRPLAGSAISDEPAVQNPGAQAAPSKVLQKIQLNTGRVRFGFVLKSTPEILEILDIPSNAEVQLKRTEIRFMSSENAGLEAARRMGIPVVLSWRVKQSANRRLKTGKIAKLDGALVYVTLGKASGLAVGDSLRVYRGDAEIRDPDTQEILGRERKLIGEIVTTDVQQSFSKARLAGEIDVEFKIGDQVEPKSQADAIAVLPFTTISGGASAEGAVLAEQLATELAKREIPVVDRAQFGRVLEELAIQQSARFDQTKVQELGRLVGAFAVLTGSVAQRGRRTVDVNCRLIEVDSGRVLLSETYPDYSISSAPPSPAPSTNAGHLAPTHEKSFPQRPANRRMPTGRVHAAVGAIAHWTFDGGGKNALGDSLNGIFIGGRPAFRKGAVNQALMLDGRDQYFSVPHENAFDIGEGDFSIALWVFLNGNADAYPVASKGGYNWKRGWTLDVGANGKRGAVRLETSGGGERARGSSQISTNQNVLSSGEWHHIAVIVKKSSSGSQTRIYVDGILEASGHVDQVSLDNSDADFYIGRIDQYRLSGGVDDVWFFRGAISEADVQSLMGSK
jgi:TolB-like protein